VKTGNLLNIPEDFFEKSKALDGAFNDALNKMLGGSSTDILNTMANYDEAQEKILKLKTKRYKVAQNKSRTGVRVKNLEAMVEESKKSGSTIDDFLVTKRNR